MPAPKDLISDDGAEQWSAAAGRADGDGRMGSPERPFFIASITKRFILTLLIQADERGGVALDAPITEYLTSEVTSELRVRGGIDRTSAITVRHLASHTSGLPDFSRGDDAASALNSILVRDEISAGR